jgi:hypothetical protein
MIDATSGSVVNDRPAGTTELMIKEDAGREREQAQKDTHRQVMGCPGSMTLEVEQILAGPEDRLDPLTDGGEMRAFLFFVGPSRPSDGPTELLDFAGEVLAGIPLVTDDGFSAPKRSGQDAKSHLSFRPVGRGEFGSSRRAVRGTNQVEPAAPEEAGVAAGPAIPTDLRKGRAPDRLQGATTLNRGGVKQKKIIIYPRALRAEDAEQPFDSLPEAGATLVVGMLGGKAGKQMRELALGGPKKAPVRRDSHEDLGDGQGYDLGVGRAPTGVWSPLWQKVIGRAINDGAEGVQVGVHRGLRADGVLDTVGFGPSASNPFFGAMFVASII